MVVDCFIFFNELDLLEIRLHVLNDVVDKFVIVEATRSFQNKSKPLHYQLNADRYKSFHHKIIHIVVDEYPSFISKLRSPTPWDFETHQRNQIKRGLINCKVSDTIILSDLDEIPRPESIEQYKGQPGIHVFKQRNFYYFLNCRCVEESEKYWFGPVMTQRKNFKKPQDLRSVSKKMHADHMRILKDRLFRFFKSLANPIYRNKISIIENGGWHFGFLGGAKKIIEKLEAFSHTEFNREEFKNEDGINEAINSGKDMLGRGLDCEFVPIDDSYPAYILENTNTYKHLIKDIS